MYLVCCYPGIVIKMTSSEKLDTSNKVSQVQKEHMQNNINIYLNFKTGTCIWISENQKSPAENNIISIQKKVTAVNSAGHCVLGCRLPPEQKR